MIDLGEWSLGWREALIGLVILLAVYMAVVLLRMRRLKRGCTLSAAAEARQAPLSVAGLATEAAAEFEKRQADRERERERAQEDERERELERQRDHLAREAFMRGIEAEVGQLREEVDALRGEVSALRQELGLEMNQMRAAQTVSPLYSDAMQMATRGIDAATISERCGIARAEAELVVALAHSQSH